MKHWPADVAIQRERAAPWLVLLAVLAPLYLLIPITHDSAWQMWLGRQMLQGADLYSDVVEVNAPLWFWLGAPIVGFADTLGVRSLSVLVGFFILTCAVSLWLLIRLQAKRELLVGFFFAVLLLPLEHFTQREHFALIAAIPYVLLIARREQGSAVGDRLAAAVGAFAAIGFALKPHFALVPLVLELWIWKPRVRPETVALAAGPVIYAAALLAFEPDYLTAAVPLVLEAYGRFAPIHLGALLAILPFLFAPALRAKGTPAAFLVASLSFLLIFLLQGKGFGYQALPALGMLLVAALGCGRIGLALALLILAANVRLYHTPPWMGLKLPPGTSFAALSVAPRAGWPMVEEQRLEWTLPYMSAWMAPAVMPDLESHLADRPPQVLLVDDRQADFSSRVPNALASYALVREDNGLKLYLRRSAPNPPPLRLPLRILRSAFAALGCSRQRGGTMKKWNVRKTRHLPRANM